MIPGNYTGVVATVTSRRNDDIEEITFPTHHIAASIGAWFVADAQAAAGGNGNGNNGNGNGNGGSSGTGNTGNGNGNNGNGNGNGGSNGGGSSTTTEYIVAGVNVPAAGIPNGLWTYYKKESDHGYYQKLANALQLGAVDASYADAGVLPAKDTWRIDSKIDDGKASSGNVVTVRAGNNSNCTTDALTAASADYILEDKTFTCRMIFWSNYQ